MFKHYLGRVLILVIAIVLLQGCTEPIESSGKAEHASGAPVQCSMIRYVAAMEKPMVTPAAPVVPEYRTPHPAPVKRKTAISTC